MGLFRSGRRNAGRKAPVRIEPRLYSRGGGPMPPREKPKRRRRRSLFAGILSFVFTLSVLGLIIGGAGFGYVWMTLDKKGLLHIPDREPGVMLLASDGQVLAERGSFFGDDVRLD